jgi:hypothetical protein
MAFLSDFFGGVVESSGVNKGDASGSTSSYGTLAGQSFFALAKEALKSGSVKDAVAARVAATPQAQQYAANEKQKFLTDFLRNPMVWGIAVVAVLVIGYAGFALGGKR